jgi:hypothetical protein
METLLPTAISIPFHTLATFGFYTATGVYLIFTTVLYFHWHEYSIDSSVSKITALTYLFTTLPLITILGVATFFI